MVKFYIQLMGFHLNLELWLLMFVILGLHQEERYTELVKEIAPALWAAGVEMNKSVQV